MYEQIDRIVGRTLRGWVPGDLLVIMSDHGFACWRRAFHLNTWLRDKGYLTREQGRRAGRRRRRSRTWTGRRTCATAWG